MDKGLFPLGSTDEATYLEGGEFKRGYKPSGSKPRYLPILFTSTRVAIKTGWDTVGNFYV